METERTKEWIERYHGRKFYEERPRRDSRKKSEKNKPKNIKNAEGRNTDSFYYVEIENADRGQMSNEVRDQMQQHQALTGFDNIDFPEHFRTPHDRGDSPLFDRIQNSPRLFRDQSAVSEKFPKSPKTRSSQKYRGSPKADYIRPPQTTNPLAAGHVLLSDNTEQSYQEKYNHNSASNIDTNKVSADYRYDSNPIRVASERPDISLITSHIPGFPNFDQQSPNLENKPFVEILNQPKHEDKLPLSDSLPRDKAGRVRAHRRLNIFHPGRQGIEKLPEEIVDALKAADRPDIQNAYDVMKDGETLLLVEHTRWVTRTVNAECRVTDDMMHVTYVRRRCWMPSKLGCGRLKGIFDIRDVLMARAGKQGLLRVIDADLPELRCFSIVFKDSTKRTLYFVASSAETAKYWVKGINFIKKNLETLLPRLRHELFMWEVFRRADKNSDGNLNFAEALEITRKSGVPMVENLNELYKKYASTGQNSFDFDAFVKFYQEITTRSEIFEIFQKYSADGNILTARELYKFIQESQRDYDITGDDCSKIIQDYERSEDYRNNKQISVQGFTLFIDSPYCDIFNRHHDEVYQDMKHPMSHYFIASSHNTYLTADQLKGPSSTDAYMNALLQGCRCVELDCWDGPDDDPVIFHGYTLTSKIKFKDAIEVIGKYAFEVSQYPLILSIENHCSVSQQEKMAAYMKKIFGTELLVDPVIPEGEEFHLPSPAALLGKILIKGKKLPPPVQHDDSDSSSDDDVSEEDEAAEMERVVAGRNNNNNNRRKPRLHKADRLFKRRPVTSSKDAIKCDESVKQLITANCLDTDQRLSLTTPSVSNQSSTRTKEQEKKLKLSKHLSDQVVYCKSSKFKGIDHGIKNTCFREISSFTENKANKLSAHERRGAIKFHSEHLDRTYPGATRTDSSNYDPQPLWNAGFQVVALNYQTKCEEMVLYNGKFRQNGKSGYILKPEFMRSLPEDDKDLIDIEATKMIKINVISGYRMPVGRDSLLQVEIFLSGDPSDTAKRRTASAETNGYNPVWNEEVEFEIQVPSLAMIGFVVRDDDSNKVGQFVLPFESVLEGYRTVHLLDRNGIPSKHSTLLIHIRINDVIESLA